MNTKIENKTYKTQKNTNLTLKTTIKDANGKTLMGNTKIAIKREKAYTMLINLIEQYNEQLLSTKVYWEKPME